MKVSLFFKEMLILADFLKVKDIRHHAMTGGGMEAKP